MNSNFRLLPFQAFLLLLAAVFVCVIVAGALVREGFSAWALVIVPFALVVLVVLVPGCWFLIAQIGRRVEVRDDRVVVRRLFGRVRFSFDEISSVDVFGLDYEGTAGAEIWRIRTRAGRDTYVDDRSPGFPLLRDALFRSGVEVKAGRATWAQRTLLSLTSGRDQRG